MLTPPPPPPVASSPPRKAGFPWLPALIFLFLMGSLLVNLVLLVAVAREGGGSNLGGSTRYQEMLVDGESNANDKIVMLSVKGVIMDGVDGTARPGTFDTIRSQLRKVKKDKKVKAILLSVNSPGGGVTESDRIYNELKLFRKETGLPIVALFGDVSASGGYYISMASDHIIAHPTTVTGSIGVISQFFQVSELMGKLGVDVQTIKSLRSDSSESFKDIGSPYRPMTPAERKLLQGLISEMWERFVAVVAEGRKGKIPEEKVRELADGRVFTGPQALEVKLVDQIGYQEDAFAKCRELGKASEAKVVRYKREPSFADLFTMSARPAPPSLEEMLREVTFDSPRFLYLWTSR